MGLRRFDSDSDDEDYESGSEEGLTTQLKEKNEDDENDSVSFSESESEESINNQKGTEFLAVLLDELNVPEASQLIKRQSTKTAQVKFQLDTSNHGESTYSEQQAGNKFAVLSSIHESDEGGIDRSPRNETGEFSGDNMLATQPSDAEKKKDEQAKKEMRIPIRPF